MYTDQGQSRQAKLLRELLKSKGLKITHAQCLEMVAKLDGHRTLHVAHAKLREVVLHELAEAQAQAVMFEDLGAYRDKPVELLAELTRLATLDDAEQADRLFRKVFREQHPVVLSPGYDNLRAKEVHEAYNALVDKLRTAALRKAQAEVDHQQVLFQGRLRDWEEEEGVLEDGDSRPQYDLKIARSGSQFYIDVVPAGAQPGQLAGAKQLGICLEVNSGKPCVHLTNDIWGDQVLTVFGLSSGLYLRPDAGGHGIRSGVPTQGTDLAEHFDWEAREPFGRRSTMSHSFIENSNA